MGVLDSVLEAFGGKAPITLAGPAVEGVGPVVISTLIVDLRRMRPEETRKV